jgi:hypothetical protein
VSFSIGVVSSIAALKYEQAEGRGRLLLAPKDQAHLNTRISFKEPVKLQDYRRVRKLLELTSDSSFLHTDSKQVFGLVEIDAGDGKTCSKWSLEATINGN